MNLVQPTTFEMGVTAETPKKEDPLSKGLLSTMAKLAIRNRKLENLNVEYEQQAIEAQASLRRAVNGQILLAETLTRVKRQRSNWESACLFSWVVCVLVVLLAADWVWIIRG